MPIGSLEKYSDIDLDMGSHPLSKDIRKKTKENSIKQAIKNLILTNPGERLFNPGWGCDLKRFLFEPIDDTVGMEIRDLIISSITNYEPRVELIDVLVLPSTSYDGYEIGLYYKIRETTAVVNQTVTLAERVR